MPIPLSINPIRDTSQSWVILDGTRPFSPTFDLSGATCVGLFCDLNLDATELDIFSNINGSGLVFRCYNDSGTPLATSVGAGRVVLFDPFDFMALRYIAFMPNITQAGLDTTVTLILRPL